LLQPIRNGSALNLPSRHHACSSVIDVYNGGSSDANVTLRSENLKEVSASLKSGELRRVRTHWQGGSSQVTLDLKNGAGLRFDNLAYSTPVNLAP